MLENKINRSTDIAIIGGGPAGLSAGIYAALDKTNFLLIEEKESCWFSKEAVNSHYYVDGFTGTTAKTTGSDLQKSFLKHYERLGGKFLMEKVTALDKKDALFIIDTDKSIIRAKAVIFSNGTTPKDLDVKNADKFATYIHYYCTIDGPQYKNKEVLVLGGRNSGAVAACYLDDLSCKVTLLELKNKIQAKEKYQKNISKRKIKVMTNSELISLEGVASLQKCIVKNLQSNELIEILCQAVFVYIGRKPDNDFIKFNLKKDGQDYLVVDCFNRTSVMGFFAAGDATCKLKQIITACGDGANAYYFAKKYIDGELKGDKISTF